MKKYIDMVHDYYWNKDLNCATTIIKVMENRFSITIDEQVIDGLIAIPGAAKQGSLCGLVTGSLMFIGIYGKKKNIKKETIKDISHDYSEGFQKRFKSLECNILRPLGFKKENPPHLCQDLTNQAVMYSIEFIERRISNKEG